ncbi:MAG: formate--tetrahydrofolate ligase, partial [Bacteroidales bacterium]
MKSDIEIARETPLKKIEEIALENGINPEAIATYGHYMAKVPLGQIDEEKIKKHHLILVTAITPTKAGIGKTTVSIGLALGLHSIGKKAIVALREPSLGPCFGMKGGAAGGGYAQVLPMENINLHFTGDFHAITSAHNMITALLDNYIYQNRHSCVGLKEIKWKRVLDVNDRNLRNIISGLGGSANGTPEETGFDITAASEIMAILCLSTSIEDLKSRIENILLGYTYDGNPFTVKDLGVAGAITVLLKDALLPNLVQTTENTAAFVHGGPFANIAHGCNSLLATKMALTFGDYAITEAGFGADLGAEKFFDIKCRKAGLEPKLSVIVVTNRSLKMHGGVAEAHIGEPNMKGLSNGFANLDKHVKNLKSFNQSVIVAFNRYSDDIPEEIEALRLHCQKELQVGFAINDAFG